MPLGSKYLHIATGRVGELVNESERYATLKMLDDRTYMTVTKDRVRRTRVSSSRPISKELLELRLK